MRALPQLAAAAGRRKDLDRFAEPLQKAVSAAFARGGALGHQAQNALNGVWLGHPLHPALTDLPIGFWTAALALDAVDMLRGRDGMAPAADVALGLGAGAAVLTAASGLADWQFTSEEPRRVGLVHAGLNTTALVLDILALILRRGGNRPAGRILALTGYVIVSAAAYLGGHLVYEDRIGVDHSADQAPPADFVPVLAADELQEDRPRRVQAGGMSIVLVKHAAGVFALAETCSHLGGPLSEGKVGDGSIVCPWHGSRFDLSSGCPLDGPSPFPQPALDVRVRNGQIEVRGRDGSDSG